MKFLPIPIALIAIIWIWLPFGGDTPAPNKESEITFYTTDTGEETATKYMRSYARLVAKGLEPIVLRHDGTMAMAKEVATASEAARKSASEGVDARFRSLKEATPEQIEAFLRSFQKGMQEVGR